MRVVAIALTALAVLGGPALAQRTEVESRSLSGPRIGLTVITGPRADSILRANNLEPTISQFGWHFEQAIRPSRTGGPSFVIQEVLLLGAVERRVPIPSGTLLMGIRFPSGLEFGLGPNVTPVGTALAVGFGWSLQYGGVSIPMNYAIVRSPGIVRHSIMVGYALEQTRDAAPAGPRR